MQIQERGAELIYHCVHLDFRQDLLLQVEQYLIARFTKTWKLDDYEKKKKTMVHANSCIRRINLFECIIIGRNKTV